MLPRTDLIRLQRALYDRLKARTRTYVGGLSPRLKRYFQDYQRDFRAFQGLSTKAELIQELKAVQAVFCGDYHSLPQAQRTVIRLVREALTDPEFRGRPLYFGLEMIPVSQNALLKKFQAGRISESEFLKKAAFGRWGFAWDNYQPLFEFARENGIQIVGLGQVKPATLQERDAIAAEAMAGVLAPDPKAWILALMGDLHIAEAHLPAAFARALTDRKLKRRTLIIHQNNESLYWRLVEAGVELFSEVVKLKAGVYCVMNTLPWIKLKNHLSWVENQQEAESLSVWQSEETVPPAHAEEVLDLVETLAEFLEMPELGGSLALDDFEIKSPGDLDFLRRWEREGVYSARQIQILSRGLLEFDSQFFFRPRCLFLTGLQLNHLASQSAQYLYAKLSGFRGVFERPDRDFYAFIWVEALGFLGSKVINPHRKCLGIPDLEREVAKIGKGKKSENRKAFQEALRCFRLEREGRRGSLVPKGPLPPEQVLVYYKTAKILGAILGQALYGEILRNRVSRADIRRIFQTDFTAGAEAAYYDWLRVLDARGARDFEKDDQW